jgi:hypothetical protein
MLDKYNLQLTDISPEKKIVYFIWDTQYERTLLWQIAAVVLPKDIEVFKRRRSPKYIGFKISAKEEAEMVVLYVTYKRAYKQELEVFETAFLYKHNLFRELSKEEKRNIKTMSKEEAFKLERVMSGMDGVDVHRQIEEKNNEKPT